MLGVETLNPNYGSKSELLQSDWSAQAAERTRSPCAYSKPKGSSFTLLGVGFAFTTMFCALRKYISP